MFDPHVMSLAGLERSAIVRFSLLAFSSIFFLVDPFAALPTFLAVTQGADALEGFADGVGVPERVRGGWAIYFQAVRDHPASVRDRGRDHPAADRSRHAGGQAVCDAGSERRYRSRGEQGRRGYRTAGDSDAGRAGVDYQRDGAGGAGAEALADAGDPGVDRDYGGHLLPG